MAIGVKLERDARRAALLASPLFQAMRPVEVDEILKFSTERQCPRGAIIVQQGDEGSSMMAVLRGRVRVSVVSPEGREMVLNMIAAGEVFGEIALLDGKPRSADVTAVEDTLLLVVERRHFVPFLWQNQDLYLRLLAVLCERLRRTSLALEELALFELPERLARLLLKLAEDYGRPCAEGVRIELKLSQRDLANQVASSRETVNKQLRIWRDEGVVSIKGGYIIILRMDELKRIVG